MYIPRILDKEVEYSLTNGKILIILGARQVGKTTLVENLLKNRPGLILNLDLEIDKARLLAASKLAPAEGMRLLGEGEILVIDEAQRYPEVGRIVKGWYDAKVSKKIILLGSSSLNLLDKTAESLTGRNEKLFLTPLLFREIIRSQSWYPKGHPEAEDSIRLNSVFSAQTEALMMASLVYGSYPETVLTKEKERYLINLISDYLLKDVLQSDLVKSPDFIKKLLLLLAYQTGSEVSVTELSRSLGTSRQTVERYLELLERVYVIFRLPSYSTNPRKEITKSMKIYFWDTGVKNALQKEFSLSPLRSDIGKLWENWVISEMMKKNLTRQENKDFYFWRTRIGNEVDLVVKDGEKLAAYEIKWSAARRYSGASFQRQYGVKPLIINRQNFLRYIW